MPNITEAAAGMIAFIVGEILLLLFLIIGELALYATWIGTGIWMYPLFMLIIGIAGTVGMIGYGYAILKYLNIL